MADPGDNEPTPPPPPPPGWTPREPPGPARPATTPWAEPAPPPPPARAGTSHVLVGVLAGVGVVLALAVVALAVVLLRSDGSSSSQVASATSGSTAVPATAPSVPDVSTLSPPTVTQPTTPTSIEPLLTPDEALTISKFCVAGNQDHDVFQDDWEVYFRYTDSGAGGEYRVFARRTGEIEPWVGLIVPAIRDGVVLDRNQAWNVARTVDPYPYHRLCAEGVDGSIPPPF